MHIFAMSANLRITTNKTIPTITKQWFRQSSTMWHALVRPTRKWQLYSRRTIEASHASAFTFCFRTIGAGLMRVWIASVNSTIKMDPEYAGSRGQKSSFIEHERPTPICFLRPIIGISPNYVTDLPNCPMSLETIVETNGRCRHRETSHYHK